MNIEVDFVHIFMCVKICVHYYIHVSLLDIFFVCYFLRCMHLPGQFSQILFGTAAAVGFNLGKCSVNTEKPKNTIDSWVLGYLFKGMGIQVVGLTVKSHLSHIGNLTQT